MPTHRERSIEHGFAVICRSQTPQSIGGVIFAVPKSVQFWPEMHFLDRCSRGADAIAVRSGVAVSLRNYAVEQNLCSYQHFRLWFADGHDRVPPRGGAHGGGGGPAAGAAGAPGIPGEVMNPRGAGLENSLT